jgi:hypothetical protein
MSEPNPPLCNVSIDPRGSEAKPPRQSTRNDDPSHVSRRLLPRSPHPPTRLDKMQLISNNLGDRRPGIESCLSAKVTLRTVLRQRMTDCSDFHFSSLRQEQF